MKFSTKPYSAKSDETNLILTLFEGKTEKESPYASTSHKIPLPLIQKTGFLARPSNTLWLCDGHLHYFLFGLGKEEAWHQKTWFSAAETLLKTIQGLGLETITLPLDALPYPDAAYDTFWKIEQLVLMARASAYRFSDFKTQKDAQTALKEIIFLLPKGSSENEAKAALFSALSIADAVDFSKNLANLPGNICTPSYLANTAHELAKSAKLKIEVHDQKAMEKLGMHSLLGVAKGSKEAPHFIALHYRRAQNAKTPPIVLIGKGITFDSGGISLKPGADMDLMKFDMSGAASVLGTLKAVIALDLPINLTVLVPAAENMPDGGALKPGDIVRSMSGQTIEILNTDAEGRLILCDALTYAERFSPMAVIDVATLTGACVIALGTVASGLFSNDENLATALYQAGQKSHDRTWEMPLWEDYQDLLKSPFADMANVGNREAGSISGACFLSRFAKKFPWAHLDIAGIAYGKGADKTSTGRPVPLLVTYLRALCEGKTTSQKAKK